MCELGQDELGLVEFLGVVVELGVVNAAGSDRHAGLGGGAARHHQATNLATGVSRDGD